MSTKWWAPIVVQAWHSGPMNSGRSKKFRPSRVKSLNTQSRYALASS